MITTGPIESFFKPPTERPSDQGDGLLFHLRRDLERLYGKEDEFTRGASAHAMLAMMGILAGIDYLSKIYSSKTGSRRFVETIKDLGNLNVADCEAIYQLRCALMHSVSLSTVSNCDYRKGTRFKFEITDQTGTPLIGRLSDSRDEVVYRINFWKLKRCFRALIDQLFKICGDTNNPKNGHVVNMIGQLHSEKLVKNRNG